MDGEVYSSIDYVRYWHGYLVIFRPLLILFNVIEIRYLILIVFLILYAWLLKLLEKRFGLGVALIFGSSLICNGFFSVSYSLESSPIFLTMIISCIVLLKNIEKIKDFTLYIFIIACIANFVDFLTVPLITLGMPILIYLMYMQEQQKSMKECVIFIIKNSIVWLIGYAFTWIAKWIIYDVFFNGEIIKEAIQQILHRVQRSSELSDYTMGDILWALFTRNGVYIILSIFILFNMNLQNKISIEKLIPFGIVACMPLTWYLVLGNHTILHAFFVYRHMTIFMCAILLALRNVFILRKRFEKIENKKLK